VYLETEKIQSLGVD
jgi:RyR and IP3R Homology associated